MLILALLLQQVAPCADWRGWDADHKRDICSPARTPTKAYPYVDRIARKMGNAEAVRLCGIRDAEWFDTTSRRLERSLWNLTIGRGDKNWRDVYAYARRIKEQQRDWTLGGRNLAGCAQLAEMPFVYRQASFDP